MPTEREDNVGVGSKGLHTPGEVFIRARYQDMLAAFVSSQVKGGESHVTICHAYSCSHF